MWGCLWGIVAAKVWRRMCNCGEITYIQRSECVHKLLANIGKWLVFPTRKSWSRATVIQELLFRANDRLGGAKVLLFMCARIYSTSTDQHGGSKYWAVETRCIGNDMEHQPQRILSAYAAQEICQPAWASVLVSTLSQMCFTSVWNLNPSGPFCLYFCLIRRTSPRVSTRFAQ